MKVAVIGAGAMGCLFAAKLAETGNQVLLIDNDPTTVAAIRRNGVRIKEECVRRKVRVPIRSSLGELGGFELILVMVKAYSTRLVATGLRNKIGSRSLILTLQNGLGNVEVLSKVFGGQVLAGSTTEASLRLGLGVIERIGRGLTVIGAVDEKHSSRVHDVVKMLKSAGFKSRPTSHIPSVVWSKAILNSAINPISAVTRLPNGQLTKIEGLRSLMLEVLGEGSRVARANGVTLRVEQLSRLLTKVLKSSARNHSSMLEDVLNSRKTEVRELNGIIAKLGRRRGVKARLNKVLTDLVLGIESSYAG